MVRRIFVQSIVGSIRVYQRFLSPLKGQTCRFLPSCSEYAIQAVVEHGALKGGALAVKRIVKCGPWHPGGFDPVPKKE